MQRRVQASAGVSERTGAVAGGTGEELWLDHTVNLFYCNTGARQYSRTDAFLIDFGQRGSHRGTRGAEYY